MENKTILVTGAAGFIGFHTSLALMKAGFIVVGLDNMSDYYDVRIKVKRVTLLKKNKQFSFIKCDIAHYKAFEKACAKIKPDHIVHLAAQAGVHFEVKAYVYPQTFCPKRFASVTRADSPIRFRHADFPKRN